MQEEIESKEILIETATFLYLSRKNLDLDFDIKELQLIIDNSVNIGYETNMGLYQLLEDKSYLETAYNQVQEKADVMDEELKEKFLSYPIQKQIIEEYNKVK